MHDESLGNVKKGEKPYPRRCSDCGEVSVVPVQIAYDAEVKQDGKLHRFHIPQLEIDKCRNCGEEFFSNRSDEQITAGLRSFLGLLQADDIRQRLEELQLSQREFAERLGVAPETVSRWVNGLSVQTRAMDNLMRVFFAFDNVRRSLLPSGPLQALGLSQNNVGVC